MTTPTTGGELGLRTVAMPADTNANGDIFGGWLLSQMDLAGTTVAARRARGRVVTVAITAMTFRRPVLVGDEVSCYAEIDRVGHSSITVRLVVVARRGRTGEPIEVTSGTFVYVAVGEDMRPRPVDPGAAPAPDDAHHPAKGPPTAEHR